MSERGGGGGGRGYHGHGGGHHGRGRGRGRGRGGGGGRGRGRGRGGGPPAGLTGREIGMWYAQQGKSKKKEREFQERGRVDLNEGQERDIRRMLAEVESLQQPLPSRPAQKPREKRPGEVTCQRFYDHSRRNDPDLNSRLREELDQKRTNSVYKTMQQFREKLPSFVMREKLVSLIKNNQVTVISGETGCGKTTQVPQFILDESIQRGQGSTCRVICTQPRRISAISVAERVANERAEKCGQGNSVGYQIRLENTFPRPQGCILYCTTGILLKWLESDRLLESVSHIVLDEVHERDILSDFLLIILKDLLPKRPDLKVILMSATLKAELFSEYFGNCPMVNIPGFTFPVTEYYLEDILQSTGYNPPDASKQAQNVPKWVKYKKGRHVREEERRKEEENQKQFEEYIDAMRGTYSDLTIEKLIKMDQEKLDIDLAAALLKHICLHKPEGAILVFLPGWDQISKLNDQLTSQRFFNSDRFLIIPLHSMMPTMNQRQVFDHPPPGVRKIIIATNIAETSITIDDVVYVVNMGRVKESNFSVKDNLRTLKAEWVSKASARQRRGRAGRVQDGECYHAYSQLRADLLEEYQLPEIQRTPLEELCLNIKTLKLGKVVPFITKAMQPPDMRAVQLALESLTQMRALDEREELTPLGYHLSRLPVEPRIGKMMLFGAMFCCLDPVLTIATSLSWKDPFYIPLGKEAIADQRRKDLSNNTRSDHLMLCNAVKGWEEARECGDEGSYCWHNFMSSSTLKMLSRMKDQFSELLYELRFVSHRSPKHPDANRNSDNEQLVKAVLCAGLYPKVAHIDKVPFNRKTGQSRPPKLSTIQDGRVVIHPKSVNATETKFSSKWLLYHLKLKSTSVFLHDTSMVEPYPLLFCGGTISWDEDQGHQTVFIDDHIKFHCSRETADLVMKLRDELDGMLEEKITRPGPMDWRPDGREGKIMRAIVNVLTMQTGNDQDYDDDRDQGFIRHGARYDVDDDYDDDEEDGGYDGGARNGGQRYGQSSGQGRRDWDSDRPGSSHWRPDSHRRSNRGNQHDRYWNQR